MSEAKNPPMRVRMIVQIDADGDKYTPAGIARLVYKDLLNHYRVRSVSTMGVPGGDYTIVGDAQNDGKTMESGTVPATTEPKPQSPRGDLITPTLLRQIGFAEITPNFEYRSIFSGQSLTLQANDTNFNRQHQFWNVTIDSLLYQHTGTQVVHLFDLLVLFAKYISQAAIQGGRQQLAEELRNLLGLDDGQLTNTIVSVVEELKEEELEEEELEDE